MAIRAHELAFFDFPENTPATDAAEAADIVLLFLAREVIPGHRRVVKVPSAIGAGHALLEPVEPIDELAPAFPLRRHHPWPFGLKVRRVIALPTALTPRLPASPRR
jgi:hypothetical protein